MQTRTIIRFQAAPCCLVRPGAPGRPASLHAVPRTTARVLNTQKRTSTKLCKGRDRPLLKLVKAHAEALAAPAPKEKVNHVQAALEELAKKQKLTVCQIAPAVRVAICEPAGLPPGSVTIGQLITGLKMLGFDFVFDTLFGADLTIMEEGHELLHRLKAHLEGQPNEPMPMFTSCCPGWIEMVEKSYPELIPYLSTCKSPQMMLAAVIKNYFAAETGYAPENICTVSIMPCVRKQGEADRPPNYTTTGRAPDVDHVITTAELAKIFQDRGINLTELPETKVDDPLGTGSGGAVLFGTTGGVMEAALRTVYEVVTETPMPRLNLTEVRGLDGIKEATLVLKPAAGSDLFKYADPDKEGLPVRVAVANGLGNAKKLIKNIQDGTAKYDFVEVMACPGGCISGGGQPRSADKLITTKRQQAMYTIDERSTLRKPHENPLIQKLYERFLGTPNGEKAHHLLHTSYIPGGPKSDA